MKKTTFTKKQIMNAIERTLKRADQERESAEHIRGSFGECDAFKSSHWTAYGIEEAMEWLGHELLKEDLFFRNGKR